jgi:hypothetical protein
MAEEEAPSHQAADIEFWSLTTQTLDAKVLPQQLLQKEPTALHYPKSL